MHTTHSLGVVSTTSRQNFDKLRDGWVRQGYHGHTRCAIRDLLCMRGACMMGHFPQAVAKHHGDVPPSPQGIQRRW